MGINWQIGLGVVLLLLATVYMYFRYTREGFQTSSTQRESPATCMMLNVILEKTKESFDNAQKSGNQTDIDLTKKVLESIEAEVIKARC